MLGENNQRVILVGRFINSHMKKMILLTAETYRQNQKIITGLSRPEGISSTSLDREIAIRQVLATQFKPKLIQKTLGHRDAVVINSTTTIAKGIYLESKDTHYKPSKHTFGQGGGESCYVMEQPTFPFLEKLFNNKASVKESGAVVGSEA